MLVCAGAFKAGGKLCYGQNDWDTIVASRHDDMSSEVAVVFDPGTKARPCMFEVVPQKVAVLWDGPVSFLDGLPGWPRFFFHPNAALGPSQKRTCLSIKSGLAAPNAGSVSSLTSLTKSLPCGSNQFDFD